MNNISQISIFEYREIENLGDLERLKIFFENIDDDKLCEKLEKRRKNGRNDYPVRTMLNLIYAMKIFEELVKFMYENLEGFGEDCAIDGKFLDTYASKNNTNKCNDNRAEHEATFSCKTYEMKDGSKKQEWHYGFRAHIICDAKYGLPIKSKVTPANNSEQTELDNLLKEMEKNDKEQYKLEKMKNLMGDAGYDNGSRNKRIKEKYNVNPIDEIFRI